jgi:hypothetical protein
MALREFERFLELKQFVKDSKPDKLSPTPLMDAVWHAALLETELYDRIEEHIGMRLHHSTSGAATDAVSSAAREARLTAMRQLYKLRYNEDPMELAEPALVRAPVSTSHHARAGYGVMALFVKTVSGASVLLHVEPTDTIEAVKEMLYQRGGGHPDNQRLIFGGKQVRQTMQRF